MTNITSAFSETKNLITVTGLSNNFSEGLITANGMFASCLNLESCDFKVPKSAMLSNGLAAIYSACGKLSRDVLSLLPTNGFSDKYIDVTNLFQSCSNLSCSDYGKLANILWNDTSKIWLNTSNCFVRCTSLDLTKIPVSWGGLPP
jgi:hypothetical protein